MCKSVAILVLTALVATMALPVAGLGPVPAQACSTDKEPPPSK